MGLTYFSPPALAANEPARDGQLASSGLLDPDIAADLRGFAERARLCLHTRMAAVTAITGYRQIIVAGIGVDPGITSRAASFCGHVVLHPEAVMVVPDSHRDERFAGNPNVLDDPRIRFYAGAPLRTRAGDALGSLCVFDPRPRDGLSEGDETDLTGLAAELMAYLERRRD